jgi:hypothetical protein
VSIECEGTTIRAFHNTTEIHSVTDATFASGGWGIAVRVNTALALSGAEADDWSAGTFVSTGHPAVKRMGGVQFAHSLGQGKW